MPLLPILLTAVVIAAPGAPRRSPARVGGDTSVAVASADSVSRHATRDSMLTSFLPPRDARLLPSAPPGADTVRRRTRAVEVSDAYEMRLRIHRYASYTMVPLFALQSVAGNQLYQADRTGAEKPGWAKGTHAVGAAGLAALFTVNTVTGVWNLWESRGNETGRTKRWIHSILLLASDAGFTYSGISAGDAEESQATRDRHRNVSYAAMASALAGYAVMLVGDH
ncbi:MAG TPA: hypothetical protein VFY85_12880 [Gemmatimonadaceae bacterium]|nr:hypothetical protein [Gemmatimonadaceae bacterium]